MKKLILLTITLILCQKVNATEIVYPKTNNSNINAASTFFVGNAEATKTLTINGTAIKTAPNGGFAQIVPLSIGENVFLIKSGEDEIKYSIIRAQPQAAPAQKTELTEYENTPFEVIKNQTPLRTTPQDFGINRLSELDKGTVLFVNGEFGDFYRIYLNQNKIGWIKKNDVKEINNDIQTKEPISFCLNKPKETKEYIEYSINVDQKVPFAINEEKGINLSVFNLSNCLDNTYTIYSGEINPIGYKISYQETNRFFNFIKHEKYKLVFKIRKCVKIDNDSPLKNIKIVIDAGHGGNEFGAIGCLGAKEKDINLLIAKLTKDELESRGAKVFMTREEDKQISLSKRVEFAEDKDALISVSIHANALPDGKDPMKNKGTSVYYYHEQAKPLADSILSEIVNQTGAYDDKVRQGSLALTRGTWPISVLTEIGYMINPDDYMLLTDPIFQKKCAKAISDGIEKYVKNISNF